MKKSIIKIIIFILILILIILFTLNYKKNKTSEYIEKTAESSFNQIVQIGKEIESEEEYKIAPIFIIIEESKNEYQLAYIGELSEDLLIKGIQSLIGYSIKINSIKLKDDKEYQIDFSNEKAPFNIKETLASEYVMYTETDKEKIAECIYESIEETIKENYENEKTVIYSVNNERIF